MMREGEDALADEVVGKRYEATGKASHAGSLACMVACTFWFLRAHQQGWEGKPTKRDALSSSSLICRHVSPQPVAFVTVVEAHSPAADRGGSACSRAGRLLGHCVRVAVMRLPQRSHAHGCGGGGRSECGRSRCAFCWPDKLWLTRIRATHCMERPPVVTSVHLRCV
ncbi:MAG: hypothetical protein E6J34_00260 [Chloroflexi bacterium]|nr:MAG: hypothetical protein E6J34_00260 [Chloroflexota bacterium]